MEKKPNWKIDVMRNICPKCEKYLLLKCSAGKWCNNCGYASWTDKKMVKEK